MREVSRARLEKAERVLDGARRDLRADAPGLAADRACYAMFHTAEALLLQLDCAFSKHGAVHGAFGKEYAKSGTLDPKFHRWLLDAFRIRQEVMYEVGIDVEPDAAKELVARAEEFFSAARSHLESAT